MGLSSHFGYMFLFIFSLFCGVLITFRLKFSDGWTAIAFAAYIIPLWLHGTSVTGLLEILSSQLFPDMIAMIAMEFFMGWWAVTIPMGIEDLFARASTAMF